jgi:hypothetical protein
MGARPPEVHVFVDSRSAALCPAIRTTYGCSVATWADVRAVMMSLAEVHEDSVRDDTVRWRVRDKLFAWERPLRRADIEALGEAAPDGPVLALRVPDLGVRAALIADRPDVFFTTPHFADYPAVLARLDRVRRVDLDELLVDAWLARAPARLAKAFLGGRE